MTNLEKQPYQQALDIKINDKFDFSIYVDGPNHDAVEMLKKAVSTAYNEFFYVFGPKGSGKSILLSSLFQYQKQSINDCLYLDCNVVKNVGAFLLDALLPKITILDNVDALVGNDDCELGLFSLYNRWYDKKEGTLIMSGSSSFDTIPFNKRDLNTRLSSGVTCQLNYLYYEQYVKPLQLRAKQRVITFPDNTAAFLVRHCNRDMGQLVGILDKLEQAQIEYSRDLTIPFVKKLLEL